ncbi:MAG: NAD(+) synthase, partial [Mycoplasmataceae bacterium]|nr:NAD(+) synthase [Mycoplasmataceae bacterium]
VIVGVSGGIDSALVASIAQKAFPNNSLGVIMPISDRPTDETDGIELCNQINLRYERVSLLEEYKNLSEKLNLSNDLTKANLQARLRMSVLYALAQENSYLVLGTDNYAEYYLGYFTKYGDGGCDLLPIVHLFKSQVFEMAKQLNLPKAIIEKAPSAGLWYNQEDEKELGFTYNEFELFINHKKVDQKIISKIEKQHQSTEHKRKSIPKPLRMDKY